MKANYRPRIVYIVGWAMAGLYNFGREIFYAPWLELLVFNLCFFTLWPLLGLSTLALLKRYPLQWKLKPIAIHIGYGIFLTQLEVTLGTWAAVHILGMAENMSFIDVFLFAFKDCFHIALLNYFCFVGIVTGFKIFRESQSMQLRMAEHKTALVRAQLLNLRTQLQPHFLFNTLNSIASLMHYDVKTADRMLNRLSDLLRMSLKDSTNQEICLKHEIEFIDAYLEVEKIRLEERLDVTWEIPQDLYESIIPPFILHPLVENAIKHGVAPNATGGNITIRAYAHSGALCLEVENDQSNRPSTQPGFGIGLNNVRSRLESMYGANHGVELMRSGLRTIARIRMPLFFSDLQAA